MATTGQLAGTSYLDSSFQNQLESVLSDQFPGRYRLVNADKSINYHAISLLYNSTVPATLRPLGDTGVWQIGNTRYMMDGLLAYSRESEERVIERAEQINALQQRNPDTSVYVYLPVNQNESSVFDEANNAESAGPTYIQALKDHLEVPYRVFDVENLDDIFNYYQSSDHHMNDRGLKKSYEEIMEMIGYDSIQPEQEDCHIGQKFYGTFSSRTGYVLDPDNFCVFDYSLSPFTITWNGQTIEMDGKEHFSSVYPSMLDEEHPYYYDIAYEASAYEPLAEYDFHQDDKPNVLVVGDSLSRGYIETLASSFNHTYRLVPYDYNMQTGKDFDYDSFIRENDIDIVIFSYGLVNYYYQDQWGDRFLQTTIPGDH